MDTRPVQLLAGSGLVLLSTYLAMETLASSTPPPVAQKRVKDSSVEYCLSVSAEQCNSDRIMLGGELLKISDVAAGTVSAAHSGSNCLTVSCDRVIFLREIYEQDTLRVRAAVNRSWASSMEVGVRVTVETEGTEVYASHFYFTFVAIPSPLSTGLNLYKSLKEIFGLKMQKRKVKVPALVPLTLLEKKRFVLAGRRRDTRLLHDRDDLLLRFNSQMLELELERKCLEEVKLDHKEELLMEIQRELILESYWNGNKEGFRVENSEIVAILEGEEIRVALKAKEELSREVKVSNNEVGETISSITAGNTIEARDTISSTLYVIRPLHVNSKNVLFGGQLMRWIEESCYIAVKRVARKGTTWKSASLDSLSFKNTSRVGDLITLRSIVTKVWENSVEVFVMVLAENRNDPGKETRLISNSFFTFVAVAESGGRVELKRLILPPGNSAMREVNEGAEERKKARLSEKAMLMRVYV